jgi:hypothetical protein
MKWWVAPTLLGPLERANQQVIGPVIEVSSS